MANYLVFLETKHRTITPTIFEAGTNYIQSGNQTQTNNKTNHGGIAAFRYESSVCEVYVMIFF